MITVIRISKARATGHVADRETVKLVMKAMDPEWMSLRATHKLKKRKSTYNESNEMQQMVWTFLLAEAIPSSGSHCLY